MRESSGYKKGPVSPDTQDEAKGFRKAHVVRIYLDDDKDSDTWVDVERLDAFMTRTRIKFRWRTVWRYFDWSVWNESNSELTDFKWIYDPTDDTIDPSPSVTKGKIKVPVRRRFHVRGGGGFSYQDGWYNLENGETNNSRKIKSRRIFHYDVPPQLLDSEGQPPAAPLQYYVSVKVSNTEDSGPDEGQYIDVEQIDWFATHTDGHFQFQENFWQMDSSFDVLLRYPLIDGGPTEELPVPRGVDPPWRLDPLQNIINVSWGGGLAVIFGPNTLNCPSEEVQRIEGIIK